MPTHAEIYQRVCKARPECAVAGVFVKDGHLVYESGGESLSTFTFQLVAYRWMFMLPTYHGVIHVDGLRDNISVVVRYYKTDRDSPCDYAVEKACAIGIFNALAEFLVPGSTNELSK